VRRRGRFFAAQGADVVITDWLMPGMDGLDLCRRLRAECANSVPYVILASVLDDPRDVENGLSAGADEYLIKPIATLALEARLIAVERMLRHHTRAKTQVAGDGQHGTARRATEADHEQHLPETLAEVARRLTFDVEKLYRWNALDQALSRAHDAPRDGR
jgi:DNA-binding response OmpR family regulator